MTRRAGLGVLIIRPGPRRLHRRPGRAHRPPTPPATTSPSAAADLRRLLDRHPAADRTPTPTPTATTAKPSAKPNPISVQALIEKKYDGRDLGWAGRSAAPARTSGT